MLSACQPSPELAQPVGSDPGAARQALARLAAEQASVPVVIRGSLPGMSSSARDRLVTSALEEGVRGLEVDFRARPESEAGAERVVVTLGRSDGPGPEAACRAGGAPAADPADRSGPFIATFCRGEDPVASVAGTPDGPDERARRRLLWRVAQRLFPDDYEDTYGVNILPEWLRVGVGGSFGF